MCSLSQNHTVVCVWRRNEGGQVPFHQSELKFVTCILESVLPPVLQVSCDFLEPFMFWIESVSMLHSKRKSVEGIG